VKKYNTTKGKIYFIKKYYIIKTINGKTEVQRDGYNSRKQAKRFCNESSTIITPSELIKYEDAWESFFDCYDIDVRLPVNLF
jgi:hypothetical protein